MSRTFAVIAVAVLLVLGGCVGGFDAGNLTTEETDEIDENGNDGHVDGELEIHHIDVGQADATLLVTPADETILIDTGDWRPDGQDVIDYLEAEDVDRIDHLVATHAHADHIGGHAAVIEHVEEHGDGVGAAYDSGVAHTSQTYENYLDAIEEYDVSLFEVVEGDDLPLDDDDVTATVLNPPEDADGNEDDFHYNSVTLVVEFGDFRYLTTGDAEDAAEQRLVDDHGAALDADVYQAGHHGSSTSSTPPFTDAVDPDAVIISSALESQYGHPHDEVLESFAERDVETYWTAIHGDVVLTVDGDGSGDGTATTSITTERDASTDATDVLDRKHAAQGDDEDATDGETALVTPTSLVEPAIDRPSIDDASAPTSNA